MPHPTTRSLSARAGDVGRFYFEVAVDTAHATAGWSNRQGLSLTAVLAVAAAILQAATEKHVSVWHVARAGLLAIAGAIILALLLNLLLMPVRRERSVQQAAQASGDALKARLADSQRALSDAERELSREREAEPVFRQAVLPRHVTGRLIRLADLPPGIWLSGRTFENCQLVGPAKLLLAGQTFESCQFYGYRRWMFVVVGSADEYEAHVVNSIVLHNTRFTSCEIHNVTIVGTQDATDAVKASLTHI